MSEVSYTLKKHNQTSELHLFEGVFTKDGKCTSNDDSICDAMNKSDSSGNKFACVDEKKARINCAQIGRQVCANCIKELYATLD